MARKNYARLMASLFQNKEQVRNTGVWMKQQKMSMRLKKKERGLRCDQDVDR